MFESFSKYKYTLLVLVLLVGGGYAFSQFYTPGQDNQILNSLSTPSEEGARAGEEIIQLLAEVQAIDLNIDFFESPVYQSLVDQSSPVEPEPVGRNNPFNDIGFGIDTPGNIAYPIDAEDQIVDEYGTVQEESVNIQEDITVPSASTTITEGEETPQ